MTPFWIITCAVMVPGVLLAAWIDYAQRRVPNWLNGALIVLGLAAQARFNGAAGVFRGFEGIAVGFALLILPWMMHGMGAGDVKLLSAIGAWFGPWMTCVAFAVGAGLGGVIAMAMIIGSGRLRQAGANMSLILVKCRSRQTMFGEFASAASLAATPPMTGPGSGKGSQLLPYGVPLTIGSLLVLSGVVFHWWVL